MKNKKLIIVAMLFVAMAAALALVIPLAAHRSQSAQAVATPSGGLPEITVANYKSQVVDAQTPLGVLFVRGDCHICAAAEQTVLAVSEQYKGRLKFVKVDILKSPDVADEFGVKIEPAIIVADPRTHGIAGHSQGVPDPDHLKQFLDLALSRIKN